MQNLFRPMRLFLVGVGACFVSAFLLDSKDQTSIIAGAIVFCFGLLAIVVATMIGVYRLIMRLAGHSRPPKASVRPIKRRPGRRKWVLLTIAVLLAIVAGAWQPVSDKLTIDNANPDMKSLAAEAGMSRTAQLVFYRTNPVFITADQVASDCGSGISSGSGYVEQGCYDPNTNRIYIRQFDSDLHNVEIVTAAHETLHAVYARLTSSQKASLDTKIEAAYKLVSNADLTARMAVYASSEPGDEDDELHSILGTEYADVGSTLDNYYDSYFIDRSMVVAANAAVNDLFAQQQSQLTQLSSSITKADSEATSLYKSSVRAAYAGDAYYDKYYYDQYSQEIDYENSLIGQYNAGLQQYNALSAEYNGQPLSQIQSVGTSAQ